MRINKQNKKVQLVCDLSEIQQMIMALCESPNLVARKLGFQLTQAYDQLGQREMKKQK